MNERKRCMNLAVLALSGSLLAHPSDQASAAKRATPSTGGAVMDEASVSGSSTKVISYGDRDIVPIKTKLRYTTLIVLPKEEQILDYTCGDKEFWIINGSQNFA